MFYASMKSVLSFYLFISNHHSKRAKCLIFMKSHANQKSLSALLTLLNANYLIIIIIIIIIIIVIIIIIKIHWVKAIIIFCTRLVMLHFIRFEKQSNFNICNHILSFHSCFVRMCQNNKILFYNFAIANNFEHLLAFDSDTKSSLGCLSNLTLLLIPFGLERSSTFVFQSFFLESIKSNQIK